MLMAFESLLFGSSPGRPPGKQLFDRVVVVQGEAHLLQVVDALAPPGRLAGRLDGGQQQGDQDRDDRDHDQQVRSA